MRPGADPKLSTLYKLCRALGVTPAALAGDAVPPVRRRKGGGG